MRRKTTIGWILNIGIIGVLAIESIHIILTTISGMISASNDNHLSEESSTYIGVGIISLLLFAAIIIIPTLLCLIRYYQNRPTKIKGIALYHTILIGIFLAISVIVICVSNAQLDIESDFLHAELKEIEWMLFMMLGLFLANLVLVITVKMSQKISEGDYNYENIIDHMWLIELVAICVFLISECVSEFYIGESRILYSIFFSIILTINYTLLCAWISNPEYFYLDESDDYPDGEYSMSGYSHTETKKIMISILSVAVVFVVAFVLTNMLRKSDAELFVGNWQTTRGDQMVVLSDGTMYFGTDDSDGEYNGKADKVESWKMESGSLIMDGSNLKTPVISHYEFNGRDCIKISSPDGKAVSYYFRK